MQGKDCEPDAKSNFLIKVIAKKWTDKERATFFHALQAIDGTMMKEWVKDIAINIQNKTTKQLEKKT
jgi:hypothetical protein